MAQTQATTAVSHPAGRGVLVAACLSALVVNANTSAVTILLPAISEDLGAPVEQLQWAVTGYLLVGAAVIVTAGVLGDVFGRRRVFLGGLLLFVASSVLIALATGAAGVIAGRMLQGAAGSTILACGMSLLSVDSTGAGQMRAITWWGAASAAGGAAGPLLGGVLVDVTGWPGLFWVDAAIAASCVPITLVAVRESRDTGRPRSIDVAGTVLIAVVLVPLVLALSEGGDWGWASAATLSCFAIAALGAVGFVVTERRVAVPLVDLRLLGNRVLVGASLAILLVAGTINALMYVLSLYFQDPAGFGMSALEAGLATLPAAAAMSVVTPFITPVAVRLGSRRAVALGFLVSAAGFAVLAFVTAAWAYAAFIVPLVAVAAGLGLANGPASSASTAAVDADEVGQASGISNMARYIGGSLAVAATATVYAGAREHRLAAGASPPEALAAGVARSSLLLAIVAACGVALAVLMARHRPDPPTAADRAAASAVSLHTVPVPHGDG